MLHLPPGGEPQGSLCLLIQCLYLLESTAGADRVRLSSRDSDTEMETDVGGGSGGGGPSARVPGGRGESRAATAPVKASVHSAGRPGAGGGLQSRPKSRQGAGRSYPAVAGLRPRAVRLQGKAVNLAERRLSQAESNARGGARHAQPGS